MGRPVRFVYFAWVRERIGVTEEVLDVPDTAMTGADVIAWLKARGDNYAMALDDAHKVRMAADREHVDPAAPLGPVREIALFPPMTGG